MTTNPTKMVAAKVSGACGFCGNVKVVPAHPANQIQPRPVATCPHTSE